MNLTDGGLRKEAFVVLKGGNMPPFVTQTSFWVFVLAVTLILIFLFGENVTGN